MLLIGAMEYDMKQIMQNISDLSDFNIEVMETDKDHITLNMYFTRKTHFGQMVTLCHQSKMSVRKPSRSTLKTKGSYATPHYSSSKLKI